MTQSTFTRAIEMAAKACRDIQAVYMKNAESANEQMKLRLYDFATAAGACACEMESLTPPAQPADEVTEELTDAMKIAGIQANADHDRLYPIDGVMRSVRVYKAMRAAAPVAVSRNDVLEEAAKHFSAMPIDAEYTKDEAARAIRALKSAPPSQQEGE